MAARTFAVFPRRPRKTFKLGRFRPTDGFARQVHDPPQNLERPGAPGALRRRDPSFARGHCGLPCISGTTRTERPQIATGAALVLSGCWWGCKGPPGRPRPSPLAPHPGRAPGAPTEVKSAARLQLSARLQFSLGLNAWKVAAGGKRNAKVACVQIIGTNGSTVRVVTRAARRANLLKYRINAAMLWVRQPLSAGPKSHCQCRAQSPAPPRLAPEEPPPKRPALVQSPHEQPQATAAGPLRRPAKKVTPDWGERFGGWPKMLK